MFALQETVVAPAVAAPEFPIFGLEVGDNLYSLIWWALASGVFVFSVKTLRGQAETVGRYAVDKFFKHQFENDRY